MAERQNTEPTWSQTAKLELPFSEGLRTKGQHERETSAASLPLAREGGGARGGQPGLRVDCIIGLNPQKDNTLSSLLIHTEGKGVEAHQPRGVMCGLSTEWRYELLTYSKAAVCFSENAEA